MHILTLCRYEKSAKINFIKKPKKNPKNPKKPNPYPRKGQTGIGFFWVTSPPPKKSLQSFTPSLPLVTDCEWKIDDGILVPIMKYMLSAPEVYPLMMSFKTVILLTNSSV